jgi:hypothetical protein
LIPDDDGTASDGAITLPYVPYTLVDQSSATDGPVIPIITPPVTDPVIVPDTGTIVIPPVQTPSIIYTQTQANVFARNANNRHDTNGRVSESFDYILSNTAGQVELYFNFRHNRNGIEVFQSDSYISDYSTLTPLKNGLAAVGVFGAERSKAYGIDSLDNLAGPNYYGNPSKPAMRNTGVIKFNHDPLKGIHYKIVITKYKKTSSFHKGGRFQYRLYYPIDSIVTAPAIYTPSNTGYRGNVVSILPPTFDNGNISTGVDQINYSPAQSFDISISGLKPLTSHIFSMDSVDQTSRCIQQGTDAYATSLLSDSSGNIIFKFMYNGGVQPAVSNYQQLNAISNLISASKIVVISNSDNTSVAISNIPNKGYVQLPLIVNGYTVGQNRSRNRLSEFSNFNLA